jgi:hypothetical protein
MFPKSDSFDILGDKVLPASLVYPSHQSAPSSSSKNSQHCLRSEPWILAAYPQPTSPFSGKTIRQSWPDPYEDLGAETFSQFIGPPSLLGKTFYLQYLIFIHPFYFFQVIAS